MAIKNYLMFEYYGPTLSETEIRKDIKEVSGLEFPNEYNVIEKQYTVDKQTGFGKWIVTVEIIKRLIKEVQR